MNRNDSDQYGHDQNNGFHTHRSERYRHPESSRGYHSDNYGSPMGGEYGQERSTRTWSSQVNEKPGYSDYGSKSSYGSSTGYGSSERNYPSQNQYKSDSFYHYDSGLGSQDRGGQDRGYSSEGHRAFGYQSDYDSHGSGFRNDSNPDLYGDNVSRRFQGSDQGSYHFDRDRDRQHRAGSQFDRSSSGRFGDSGMSSQSSGYDSSEGNYMGSGYSRTSNQDYGSGNYGSMGSYDRGSSDSSYRDTSGRGGSNYNRDYARDTENTRIQHPDSHYDYDPNHSFDVTKDKNYITSHNRNRRFDRDRERGYDRY
jgi:hypothetical protein